MQMPDDIAARAHEAISRRPYAAHELADYVWPDRAERPLAARSRGGHACGRDLVQRGLAIQNPDGTYSAATSAPPPTPTLPAELHVQPDGQVIAVERRAVGKLASDATPTPAASPMQPAELYVAANGEVLEVQRRSLGRVAAVPERAASGELVVDASGNVVRITKEVIGRAQLPTPPQAPAVAQPASQTNELPTIVALLHEVSFSSSLDPDTRRGKLGEAGLMIMRNQVEPVLLQVFGSLWNLWMTPPPSPQVAPPVPPAQPPPAVNLMAMMQATLDLFQKMQAMAQQRR